MSEQKVYRILRIGFIGLIATFLLLSVPLFLSGERLRRWYRTGWRALDDGDYVTAAETYERYLSERPFDSDTWGDLAEAYFHTGRYDECIDALSHYAMTAMSFDDENFDERHRQRLIRYVECVRNGEDFGEEPPVLFSLHTPEDHDGQGKADNEVPDS